MLPPSQTMMSASGSAARSIVGIVDAGEYDIADGDVRLVFLSFLDRAVGGIEIGRATRSAAPARARDRRRAWDAEARRPASRGARSRSESQRAIGDLPQPVRTAVTAITGMHDDSMVRLGPSSMKSAPTASAREAICITCSCGTSL